MPTIKDIRIPWESVPLYLSTHLDDEVGHYTDGVFFSSEEGHEAVSHAVEEIYRMIQSRLGYMTPQAQFEWRVNGRLPTVS